MTEKLVRAAYVEFIKAHVAKTGLQDWFWRSAVYDSIVSNPQHRELRTMAQVPAHLNRRAVRRALQHHFQRHETADIFVASEALKTEVQDVCALFRETGRQLRAGRYIPDAVWIDSWNSMADAHHAVKAWREWKQEKRPRARRRLAVLDGGYTLYSCGTYNEAIRIGRKTGTCLAYYNSRPPLDRPTAKTYEPALHRGDLCYLTDPQGEVAALVHMDSEKRAVLEVNGPVNGGMQREPALLLRDYFGKKGFVPADEKCGRYLGLVRLQDGSYVPYEEQLPWILKSPSPDVSRLPVTNAEMAPLKDRIVGYLNITQCLALTQLPPMMAAKFLVCYIPDDKFYCLDKVEAVNEWLAIKGERPALRKGHKDVGQIMMHWNFN
jgi:hypothetical protein